MVRICEVGSKEGREGAEPCIHSLAHVADSHLVPFRHCRVGGGHQHVLQSFLHSYGSLLLGGADETNNGMLLQRLLLEICLKLPEVIVGGLRYRAQIFFEFLSMLLRKALRALQHLQLPDAIHKNCGELRRVPPGIRICLVPHAVRVQMIFQLLLVHKIPEQPPPRDLRRSLKVRRTISIKEFRESSHPCRRIKDIQGSASPYPQRRRCGFPVSCSNAAFKFVVETIAHGSRH